MSFPHYRRYKDSAAGWLGQVPDHWDIHPIKRVARLKSGDSIGSELIEEVGVYPVFGGNGLRGYTSSYTHEGNYVLIGRQGALCGNVNYANGKFWASEHAVVVSPISSIEARWLGEVLRAMNLNQYSMSAAQPGLAVELISGLRIPVPPLSEQAAIADFLGYETGKIDALISEQHRLIGLLREKRQAVIAHAVTKGLNPDGPMKDSAAEWAGVVPRHWSPIRLGALFRETAESGNDDLPVLSVSIHHGVSDKEFNEEELERKVTRSEDRSKYIRVKPGDLVYNMMRAWQGAFGTVKVEGMVSPAYVVARPRFEVRTEFVEYLLRTPQAIEELRRHSNGVTDFRLRLYWDEFKAIKIALPPLSEQHAILKFISAEAAGISALIAESERAITLLQERRTALISAAVTGKIDVRGLVDAKPKQVAAA